MNCTEAEAEANANPAAPQCPYVSRAGHESKHIISHTTEHNNMQLCQKKTWERTNKRAECGVIESVGDSADRAQPD